MVNLLKPRWLLLVAIAGVVFGVAALYAGYDRIGPLGVFVGIFCTILAAIMLTTPEAAVAAARQQLYAARVADTPAAPVAIAASASESVPEEPTPPHDDEPAPIS